MLSNTNVFILGITKFDAAIESTSYTVAKFLARKNRVFYIDYPYTWKDYFLKRDAAFKKRQSVLSFGSDGVIDTELPNLKIVIVPPLLSINFLSEGIIYRRLLRINEFIIANRVKQVIRKFSLKEYIFINSFNFHYPNVVKHLNASLYVYHCVDPLIVSHDVKHGRISEAMIVQSCDLIICTSKQLFKEKKAVNPHTYFVPNAADVHHSRKANNMNLPIHESLLKIARPIVGYFGNIERRIDFKLLNAVVKSLPEVNFVFAGPVDKYWIPEEFQHLPNVYFIGHVPYAEMPAVLKGFNVAIIPFKKDEVSQTIFPLKLFEYLGTGKPVIATDFNLDLREFTFDSIPYCSDPSHFTYEIKKALISDTNASKANRIAIAEENSWEKRLAEISNLLAEYLSRVTAKYYSR